MSLRKAASCGNVAADHLEVALCNAKCHMSRCSVTVPEKPFPRDKGWEAVFAGTQTVWVMFVLL